MAFRSASLRFEAKPQISNFRNSSSQLSKHFFSLSRMRAMFSCGGIFIDYLEQEQTQL